MDKPVLDLAVKQVITVDINSDLTKVCSILSDEHLKKIPVVQGNRLVGIINASNVTKYILKCMG
jgi:predicted transcriptional regulator